MHMYLSYFSFYPPPPLPPSWSFHANRDLFKTSLTKSRQNKLYINIHYNNKCHDSKRYARGKKFVSMEILDREILSWRQSLVYVLKQWGPSLIAEITFGILGHQSDKNSLIVYTFYILTDERTLFVFIFLMCFDSLHLNYRPFFSTSINRAFWTCNCVSYLCESPRIYPEIN